MGAMISGLLGWLVVGIMGLMAFFACMPTDRSGDEF